MVSRVLRTAAALRAAEQRRLDESKAALKRYRNLERVDRAVEFMRERHLIDSRYQAAVEAALRMIRPA